MDVIEKTSITARLPDAIQALPQFLLADSELPIRIAGCEEIRQLSREFVPVIVLVPAPPVEGRNNPKRAAAKNSVAERTGSSKVLDFLAKAVAPVDKKPEGDFAFGDVKVSFSSMEASRKGEEVKLTFMEFKTLKYLTENATRVISRDEMLNEVWGYDNYPCTRTVDNHILRLRRKLERDPSRPVHFQTVHGAGYKFSP